MKKLLTTIPILFLSFVCYSQTSSDTIFLKSNPKKPIVCKIIEITQGEIFYYTVPKKLNMCEAFPKFSHTYLTNVKHHSRIEYPNVGVYIIYNSDPKQEMILNF
jgi:hypothetical protein